MRTWPDHGPKLSMATDTCISIYSRGWGKQGNHWGQELGVSLGQHDKSLHRKKQRGKKNCCTLCQDLAPPLPVSELILLCLDSFLPSVCGEDDFCQVCVCVSFPLECHSHPRRQRMTSSWVAAATWELSYVNEEGSGIWIFILHREEPQRHRNRHFCRIETDSLKFHMFNKFQMFPGDV